MVSIAVAVFPVERSPMISSRWPRPTFVIESIALMPVMSGSFTGWRSITPRALYSRGRVSCPPPSPPRRLELERPRLVRLDPSASVERVAERIDDAPEQRLADGNARDLAGASRRLALAHLFPVAEERGADVVLLEVEGEAGDTVL